MIGPITYLEAYISDDDDLQTCFVFDNAFEMSP